MKITKSNIFKDLADKQIEIKLFLSTREFENMLVNMLVSGVSFRFFENAGLKFLTKRIEEKFNISLNRKSIVKILDERYLHEVNLLKNNVKNRFINIKLDGVSIHNRYFMGINLQYIKNKKLESINIGLEEIIGQTNAYVLKYVLLDVLKQFEIKEKQIISIVTDNGTNYLKCGRLLNEKAFFDDKNIFFDDEELNGDELFNDIKEYESFVIADNTFENIQLIKCGCHTLQLAIHDSLKGNHRFIGQVREVVKVLRNPLYRGILKNVNLPIPKIDIITRWNSTYYMIESVLVLKDFIKKEYLKDSDIWISDTTFLKATEFIENYKHLEKLTLKLQISGLLYSDFIVAWLDTEGLFEELSSKSDTAKRVYECLRKKTKTILENKLANTALFLDNRYHSYIVQDGGDDIKLIIGIIKKFGYIISRINNEI